jgi:hypothetical protein
MSGRRRWLQNFENISASTDHCISLHLYSVYTYNIFQKQTAIVLILCLLRMNTIFLFIDLERLISRLLIDGYLKQEFIDQSPSVTAYLCAGVNAVQLTSSNSPRLGNTTKIQIELTIRIEQMDNKTDEDMPHPKQQLIEQTNERCFAELKKELRLMFGTNTYSNIISEQTIKELVKLMP